MTILELKELISELPDDMQVLLPHGEESLISACYENSEVTEIELEDNENISAFLIVPCNCSIEDAPIDFIENPN